MSAQCRHEGRTIPPLGIKARGMKQKSTNTVITALLCPDGKSDIKSSDTEVRGLNAPGTAAQVPASHFLWCLENKLVI